jgi:hypothetical protein
LPPEQEKLAALRIKLDAWSTSIYDWFKKLQKSQYWKDGTHIQMMLTGGHLIYLKENVKVVYLREMKNGNNGDIQKCCIKGNSAISTHWKFAVKTHKPTTNVEPKMWFNAEAMTSRSPHASCIKWIAVHPSNPEEYIF